jgi:serine/threonine-protein kinase
VSIALMHMQAQPKKPTEINSSIPDGLEEITLKAMQKESSKRYQTAGELITDIEEFKKNPSIVFEYKYFSTDDSKTKYFDKPATSPLAMGLAPSPINPSGRKEAANQRSVMPAHDEYDDEDDFDDDYYDEVVERRSPLLAILFATASVIVIMAAWLIFTIVTETFKGIEEGGGDEIKMPPLVGQDFDAVVAQYPNLNFDPINQEYSAEYEKGQVIRQSVLAGREIRTGQRIEIWVSMGPQLVELNNYEGGVLHIDEVKARLRRQGFPDANINVRNEESAEVPPGFVIRTDPPAGEMIPLDRRITVWVSFGGGNEMTLAPDLVDLTRTLAEEKAKTHDVVALFVEEYSDTIEEGIVISQDPLPMVTMPKFGTIEVVVSAGPAPPKTFIFDRGIGESLTGDYIFEYYIDGIYQEGLTSRQDIGLNKRIFWEAEGTGVHQLVIYITSVETGRRLQFCEYEVDFTEDVPVSTEIMLNSRIFTELSVPSDTPPPPPEPVYCPECFRVEDDCICHLLTPFENGGELP